MAGETSTWIAAAIAITMTGLLPARAGAAVSAPPGMALVGPGEIPILDSPAGAEARARVAPFFLDRLPVTNGDFLAFVIRHPEWRRGAVPRLFADARYLAHWQQPTEPGASAGLGAPVINVSWFAAKAYCEARGARLPTENEWELAALAPDVPAAPDPDARRRAILAWYARPAGAEVRQVGLGKPNTYGIRDLHELVWEWVHDFNNRSSSDGRRVSEAFACGGTSLRGEKTDYAAFMRMAFRASLRGHYTTKNLGFRCAADVKEKSS